MLDNGLLTMYDQVWKKLYHNKRYLTKLENWSYFIQFKQTISDMNKVWFSLKQVDHIFSTQLSDEDNVVKPYLPRWSINIFHWK